MTASRDDFAEPTPQRPEPGKPNSRAAGSTKPSQSAAPAPRSLGWCSHLPLASLNSPRDPNSANRNRARKFLQSEHRRSHATHAGRSRHSRYLPTHVIRSTPRRPEHKVRAAALPSTRVWTHQSDNPHRATLRYLRTETTLPKTHTQHAQPPRRNRHTEQQPATGNQPDRQAHQAKYLDRGHAQ